MATKTDFQVAALAAGFSLGFGFLTAWEAIKQTRLNKNPLRSTYVYMVWGEIAANLVIAILGWVFLEGIVQPTLQLLFFILFCWVFEIQLIMQIIVNRIAVIAESQEQVRWIKYGTAAFITVINILVFIIWIPAHMDPPVSQTFVDINRVWDPISKVLILIADAGLNWYFVRTVKERLLNQHGLHKYAPLVAFNTKLLVVSILMDVMIIGLLFLPNPIVYIQFHPVAYLVKLNIEMSLANLISRLARSGNTADARYESNSQSDPRSRSHGGGGRDVGLKSFTRSTVQADGAGGGTSTSGIQKRFDVQVTVEPGRQAAHKHRSLDSPSCSSDAASVETAEDRAALAHNPGYPRGSSEGKFASPRPHADV